MFKLSTDALMNQRKGRERESGEENLEKSLSM